MLLAFRSMTWQDEKGRWANSGFLTPRGVLCGVGLVILGLTAVRCGDAVGSRERVNFAAIKKR